MANYHFDKKTQRIWDIHGSKPYPRVSWGPPRRFEGPEEFYEEAMGYFKWLEENPVQEHKTTHHEGRPRLDYAPKSRPATMKGLASYLGINIKTLNEWANPNSDKHYRPDLAPAIDLVRQYIHEEKFVGAAVGIYNSNFIMRDLSMNESIRLTSEVKNNVEFNINDGGEAEPMYAHPDDPTGDSGWLFTKEQIDAGIPLPSVPCPRRMSKGEALKFDEDGAGS